MRGQLSYLTFGLLALAAYWFTVQRGYVYYGADHAPSPPGAHGSARGRPTFWSTGYQGGK
ncbi:MAG: hypothetical protein ABW252_18090 [Polyangiales bacterium]